MTIDLHSFPQTFDLLHLILLGLFLLALVFAFIKRSRPDSEPASTTPVKEKETSQPANPEPVVPPQPAVDEEALITNGSLHLLSLMQHHARLVDFLREDLSGFSDADIGAAARVVHEGGSKLLKDYLDIQPVHASSEESRVSVPVGFDATEIRLTGNIRGDAPYSGVLIHRGWKVTRVDLPMPVKGHNCHIVAPAEVEL